MLGLEPGDDELDDAKGSWSLLLPDEEPPASRSNNIQTPRKESRTCSHYAMQAVEDEEYFLSDCPFCSVIRRQQFSLFHSAFHQRDICLSFGAKSDQLPLVATHIHLCFQARMSDGSHLAPRLGL